MDPDKTNQPTKIYNLAGSRRKWLIIAGSVAGMAILVMVLAANKPAAPAQEKTLSSYKVRRDNLVVTVTESGSIKARKSIDLKSEVEGRATIINIVPEGSFVTQEDVDSNKILVELDSGDLREQLTQRQIDFTTADASYTQAKEAYDIQIKQNESDITAAQLKVKFALMDFQKYLGDVLANRIIDNIDKNVDPNKDITNLIDSDNILDDANDSNGQGTQDIDNWKDKIKLATANLANAKYKLEGTQELFDANYVAKIELDRDALERDSYEIQEKQALVSLNLYQLYDFPKQTQNLLSGYYESKRNLERTFAKARAQLAQAKAQLESAKARLDLQTDRLAKAQRQLAACSIKAPAPGLVVYGSSQEPMNRYRGTGLIAPGEQVFQRQTIITLPDTSEMMAEITVHESSVDKVKPGQRATVVMDAFPDQSFTGAVIKVAPLPDQQRNWLSPDIKVYTTQVSIDGTHNFLKPGMSARVEILVDSASDVLTVPIQVVANRSGKKICFVVNGGKAVEREVKTGLFNDTSVQILEGLQPDDEVLLNPPRITETKAVAANQKLDKFKGAQDQTKPMVAQANTDGPQTSNPDAAGRKIQDPPGDTAQGRPSDANQSDDQGRGRRQPRGDRVARGGDMPFDPNQMDDQTRERMKQFRERMQRGDFDPNQMDDQTRERIRQFRNRSREQGNGGNQSRQEP